MTGAATGTLACVGCGYVAERLARRLAAEGWQAIGTARDPERAERLRSLGIRAFAPDSGRAVDALATATHLLLSAAPTPDGDPVLPLVAQAAERGASPLRWIGYLSSTSVYGDAGGAWVDETSPCNAGFERGKRRIAAEAEWQRFGVGAGVPVRVFRLAGIYGPGRNQLAQLRAGRARRIVKPGQVFSRIHVDDIASALEAAILRGTRYPVYNLADDGPAATAEVATYAALLLGIDPPPHVRFEDPSISDRLRSMYSECRRVSNARMKRDLLPALRFPTYREGLRAILEAGEA